MTYRHDFSFPIELIEQVSSQGFDILPVFILIIVNVEIQVDRYQYLDLGLCECSVERRAQANGFKHKRVKTRVGEIACDVPQVQDGGFCPVILEKGIRIEQALTLA